MQSHFAGIGVNGDVGRSTFGEGVFEEARATAHIDHDRAIERVIGVDLGGGILRQCSVENFRM